MTDQSRVEAVARAIAIFVGNDPDARQLGRKDSPLLWELHKSCAQAAIAASDAWLTKQGFMLLAPGWSNHWLSPNAELPKGNVCNPTVPEELYTCERCGTRNDLGDECRGCGESDN